PRHPFLSRVSAAAAVPVVSTVPLAIRIAHRSQHNTPWQRGGVQLRVRDARRDRPEAHEERVKRRMKTRVATVSRLGTASPKTMKACIVPRRSSIHWKFIPK